MRQIPRTILFMVGYSSMCGNAESESIRSAIGKSENTIDAEYFDSSFHADFTVLCDDCSGSTDNDVQNGVSTNPRARNEN